MKQEEIFRKTALERLSSPEQLDRLVTLTHPQGWLTLFALCMLLIGILIWGIYGNLPTYVQGNGILISQGGRVFDAVTQANGVLSSVAVSVGDRVERGQVIAYLEQIDLEQQYQHAQIVLQERQREYVQLKKAFTEEFKVKRENFTKQQISLRNFIEAAQKRLSYQEKTLKLMEKKAEKGYVSRLDIEKMREKYHATAQDISRSQNEIYQLEANELDLAHRQQQALTQAEQNLNAAKRRLEELTLQLSRSSEVISPSSGRVTEIKASVGNVVAVGAPILSLESTSADLQLILYIPPTHGKKVMPGMEARIAPAPVRKEEFGTLIGKVVSVSEFPATLQGMAAVLQNDNLVKQFSQTGPPYVAYVSLFRNLHTPSGYQWSSGIGPPITITSGTLAAAEITVKEQMPISLVIPLLREYTGIGP